MAHAHSKVLIAPSILAADFGRLADELKKVEAAGADWIHVDVMDGHFVPNLTMGPCVIEAIRKATQLPLDLHLMVEHPERYLQTFVNLGADMITVHQEASGLAKPDVLTKTLESIRAAGAKAGLSIRPKTPVDALKPFMPVTDLVLVMSVEPGFGGQAFIPDAVPKVERIRTWYQGDLSVDGGITIETGKRMREAGANILVAGTSVFRAPSYHEAIKALRGEK